MSHDLRQRAVSATMVVFTVICLVTGGTRAAEAVRAEIERTGTFIGTDGIFTMSPDDHMGLGPDSFVMVEV